MASAAAIIIAHNHPSGEASKGQKACSNRPDQISLRVMLSPFTFAP
ncbi:MAG TPA: JAB domain-containing protein [Verrucomicrobiae bacterium]|nr:JAB domain-containing protein [Verrucomicrobiae bacterium]